MTRPLDMTSTDRSDVKICFPDHFEKKIVLWLNIRQLVVYHKLLSVYRIRVSGQPDDLARCLRRENYRGKILVQNCRLELYRRSFIPRGSTLWNRLPSNIRMVPNQEMFKREIKGWIKNNIKMFENWAIMGLLVNYLIILIQRLRKKVTMIT